MGIIAYCLQIDPLQETTQGGLAIPASRFFFYQFLIVSTVTRFKSTGWIYLSHSLPLSFCHSGEIQGGQWQDLRRSAWLCCWSPPGDQSIVKWSWNEWRFSQTWFLNYLPLSNCLHFVLSHRWPPRRTQAIPAKLLKTLFSSNKKISSWVPLKLLKVATESNCQWRKNGEAQKLEKELGLCPIKGLK